MSSPEGSRKTVSGNGLEKDEKAPNDDVIGIAGESEPLLEVQTVIGLCQSVQRVYFSLFKKSELVFTFTICEPAQFEGLKLRMFARIDDRWKTLRPSTKLYKVASIALGRRLRHGEKVHKSMFLQKLFRCRLRTVGDGLNTYSIVDTILEKVAG